MKQWAVGSFSGQFFSIQLAVVKIFVGRRFPLGKKRAAVGSLNAFVVTQSVKQSPVGSGQLAVFSGQAISFREKKGGSGQLQQPASRTK